jgi:hypothetical protein
MRQPVFDKTRSLAARWSETLPLVQ